VKGLECTLAQPQKKVTDVNFTLRINTFQNYALSTGVKRSQDFSVECGSAGRHMRQAAESRGQCFVIFDPVVLGPQKVDVGGGAQQALFQFLLETVVNRQSHNQRAYASHDP